jgi:hypothetical protein
MSDFQIEIVGLDKLLAAFDKFPNKVKTTLARAGMEAARKAVLPTKGLQKYPAPPASSTPPAPYYKRGVGYMYADGGTKGNSERLGTQWYVKSSGYQTKIGNRASYARWVHDEKDQATAMATIGWRKLFDVAKEKKAQITKIYQTWVNKTLREIGLL